MSTTNEYIEYVCEQINGIGETPIPKQRKKK